MMAMERPIEPESRVLTTPGPSTTGGGAQCTAGAIVPSWDLESAVKAGLHVLGGLAFQGHKRIVAQEEAANARALVASRLP